MPKKNSQIFLGTKRANLSCQKNPKKQGARTNSEERETKWGQWDKNDQTESFWHRVLFSRLILEIRFQICIQWAHKSQGLKVRRMFGWSKVDAKL